MEKERGVILTQGGEIAKRFAIQRQEVEALLADPDGLDMDYLRDNFSPRMNALVNDLQDYIFDQIRVLDQERERDKNKPKGLFGRLRRKG